MLGECSYYEQNIKLSILILQILLDKNKTIEELQVLVEAKEREKNELQTQLDEEKR